MNERNTKNTKKRDNKGYPYKSRNSSSEPFKIKNSSTPYTTSESIYIVKRKDGLPITINTGTPWVIRVKETKEVLDKFRLKSSAKLYLKRVSNKYGYLLKDLEIVKINSIQMKGGKS